MATPYIQSFHITGKDILRAGRAAAEIKSILRSLGVDGAIIRRVAIAAYEAEMNIVMYAIEGEMTFSFAPDAIHLRAEDRGPGIPNVELAMQEGWSTATPEMREMGFGAGMGLPNIRKNVDRFEILSEVGTGTKLELAVELG